MKKISTLLILSLLVSMIAPFAPAVYADSFSVKPMADAGGSHNVFLKSDGTVWTSGGNASGQLGDGTTVNKSTPVNISSLSRIVSVSAGDSHTSVVKSDGTVWSWGLGSNGRLGNGSTITSTTPVQASSLSGAKKVSAGLNFTVATTLSGGVFAWGSNSFGQLAISTATTSRTTPSSISSLSGIVDVSAGSEHVLALKNDGTVWAWGRNESGQVGNGGTTTVTTPTKINSLTNVIAIAAGGTHSMALKSDGTVWAWGYNEANQLGDGTATTRLTPIQITSLTNIQSISVGSTHSLAVDTNGDVYSWGHGGNGKLGHGNTTNVSVPTKINSLSGVISVSGGTGHTVAIMSDYSVKAWGSNTNLQAISGSISSLSTAIQLNSITGVSAISSGEYYSVALKSDGTVWSWGHNLYGQLGDGTTVQKHTPTQVTGLTGITAISAGDNHVVALKSDGTVWSWGANSNGQLGDGTTTNRSTPVQVSGLTGITAVSAGGTHTIALKSDGSVWAWGNNASGQLGNNTNTNSSTPVQVRTSSTAFLTGATTVEAGKDFSLAITGTSTTAKVASWGNNSDGQLGRGTIGTNTKIAATITTSGLVPIAISAGATHATAIVNSTSALWTWGSNNAGELGRGTVGTDALTPASTLQAFTKVSAGNNFTTAVRSDGTVSSHGSNASNQLGNGNTTNSNTPVQATGLTSISNVAAGNVHGMALKSDGTVWVWGQNTYNQLGQVYSDSVSIPNSWNFNVQIGAIDTNAPDAPANLVVQPSIYMLDLSHNEVIGGDIAGYEYYLNGSYKSYARSMQYTTGPATSVQFTDLSQDTEYVIQVKTVDFIGNKSAFATVTARTLVDPTMPTNVAAGNITMNSVTISWNAATDPVDGYTFNVDPFVSVLDVTTSDPVVISGLSPNTTYTVGVRSYTGRSYSPYSNVTFTTLPEPDLIAPSNPTNLSYSGITYNSATLNWTASTDNVAVTEYIVFNGSDQIGTAAGTTLVLSNLSELTNYNITVKAKDAAGNLSGASNSTSFTTLEAPDTTAPSAPAGLAAADVTQTSLSLSWNASTDNKGVVGYEIWQDGAKISDSSTTSHSVSGLSADTNYSFVVYAVDAAGNKSASSEALSVRTLETPDTTAPTVPTDLSAANVDHDSFDLSWSASSDNKAVTGYDIYIDGDLIGSTSGTTYQVGSLSQNTSYTVTIKAKDAAGNTSDSSDALQVTTDILSDTTAPSVPSDLSVSSVTESSVTFSWTASTDNTAVAGYEVYKDGVLLENVTDTTYTANGLDPATDYKFTVKSVDSSGNKSDFSMELSVTTNSVDLLAPTAPAGLTASNVTRSSIRVNWEASIDNVEVVSYSLYKNGVLVTTTSNLYAIASGLAADTSYAFTVTAKDAAGNVSDASAELSVKTLEVPKTNLPQVIVSPDNKTLTINFTEAIFSAAPGATATAKAAAFKAGVIVTRGTGETATVERVITKGRSLVISLSHPLTTNNNTVRIESGMLKDAFGNTISNALTTEQFNADTTGPSVVSYSLSTNNKILTITLSESVVINSTVKNALKNAVTIGSGDSFVALDALDSVTVKGNTVRVTRSNSSLGGTQIKIAAGIIKDGAGNVNSVVTTDVIMPDMSAPEATGVTLSADNKTITIKYNKAIVAGVSDRNVLLAGIGLDRNDGNGFVTLSSAKILVIKDSLVIMLGSPLSSTGNKIKLHSGIVKSLRGVQSAGFTSEPFDSDLAGPALLSTALNSSKNTITINLSESSSVALLNKAPIKSAIKIKLTSTGEFVQLALKDKVTLKGSTITIVLASPLTESGASIKVDANALRDTAGNKSSELVTPEIQFDTEAPDLV